MRYNYMREIFAVRHAEPTHFGLDPSKYLMTDEGRLSKKGRRKILSMTDSIFTAEPILFCSREIRCIQTALELEKVMNLKQKPKLHSELTPRRWGNWERIPKSLLPKYIQVKLNDPYFAPPNGESRIDVAKRVLHWYNQELTPLAQDTSQTIIIITHSMIIDMIINIHRLNIRSENYESILLPTNIKTEHCGAVQI
jgi:broad specificity phosphatase PhoE